MAKGMDVFFQYKDENNNVNSIWGKLTHTDIDRYKITDHKTGYK